MHLLREQLTLYGAETLSTLELLSLTLEPLPSPTLLASLAHLLQAYPLSRLSKASVPELQEAGLSAGQAETLVALCELTRRFALPQDQSSLRIRMACDALVHLRPFLEHLDHETFRVLVLNIKQEVVANLELYRGTVDSTVIRIAEVLRPTIVRNCPLILVAHCHPSGDPEASPEDVLVTEQLVQAAKLLDIAVLDHLILGNQRFVSLRDKLRW